VTLCDTQRAVKEIVKSPIRLSSLAKDPDLIHMLIIKSLYLSEKLSDFDEIWYTLSSIEPGYSHVTKK